MPKTLNIQTNLTAGEISPRLLGRVDIDKYRNAAERMVNCHPLVHGGCQRRAGKRRIAATKYADRVAILIPVVISKIKSYQIEVGDLYIRFYTQDRAQVLLAGLPYELASPFTEAELDDIRFVQRAGYMYLAHVNHPIQQLTRTADNDWKLVATPFDFEPTDEILQLYNTTATLSALTGGITITAGAAAFINADVGRTFSAGNGTATITAFTDTTHVNATVVDNFTNLVALANAWALNASPKTTITPSAVGPLGAAVTVTSTAAAWQNNAQYTHVGKFVNANGGLIELTGFTSSTVMNGIVRSVLANALAVGSDGWTLETRIWGGARGYPNAVGLYQQRLIAAGSPGYPQTVWGTKTGDYVNFATGASDGDGFTFSVNSDQMNQIQHVTNSKALAVFTYGGEVTMKGGQEKALSSTNVQSETQSAYGCNDVRPLRIGNEILFWTRSGRKLRAFAYQITNDSYTSPDMTVLAEHITSPGIVQMSYAQEPDSLIYALRADGVLAGCAFDRDQNVTGWFRDITDGIIESVSTIPAGPTDQTWNIIARAVGGAIVRSVEVDDPDLNTDFAITGSNFVTVQADLGWAAGVYTLRITGNGFLEGETIRIRNFINRDSSSALNGDFVVHILDPDRFTIAVAVNPGPVLSFGEAAYSATTWTGFAYCEGRDVRPLADGSPQPVQQVIGGQIVLQRPAYEMEAGIEYANFVDILPIEQPGQFGTAQGSQISVNRITARFYNTVGATMGTADNQTQIPTRAFGEALLNMPVAPFTGDIDLSQVGWDFSIGGRVRIGQVLPLPWQLLAVIRECTVNNG